MDKKQYMSEEDVKKALDITDFRSMTKEKIMNFVSIIPEVDKEVAISIINQFPNYTDMAKDMVGKLMNLCELALTDAKSGKKEVIESYRLVLETLRNQLDDGVITPEERARINEQMISVAEKIDNVNDKHNAFIKDILTKVGRTVVGGALILGVAILGINRKDD